MIIKNDNMKKVVCITMLFLTVFVSFSQKTAFQIPDSINSMGYEELADAIYLYEFNSASSELYAKVYLHKGIKTQDTLKIAEGYHFLSYLENNKPKKLMYLDSIINITSKKRFKDYPASAYLNKGAIFYKEREIRKALDNYIRANPFSG